jgi:antirestriction protein ArdC
MGMANHDDDSDRYYAASPSRFCDFFSENQALCGIIRVAALCALCRIRHKAHSTGHSKHLDRTLDSDPKPFGTPDYGKEELVAEMAAAFLCGHAGITPTVLENQAAYLQGWLKTLKADKKLVIGAAGQAQRAADWIRNERTPLAP